MGAHHGPDRHEERQQGRPRLVPRLVDIAVEQRIGVDRQLAPPEIHQHEGEIVEHIRRREIVAEFQAVEQGRHAIDLADVAQVQIAMAAPDEAAARPQVEPPPDGLEGLPAGLDHRADLGLGEDGGLLQGAFIDRQHPRHAPRTLAPHRLGLAMQPRDRPRQELDIAERQLTLARQPVEQGPLVEADHLDHRIDQRPAAIQCQPAILLPRDPVHRPVERRRRTPVEAQLVEAGLQPLLGRGEIEIGQAQPMFQLDRAGADQQHGGDMRDRGLDGDAAAAEAVRGSEKGE